MRTSLKMSFACDVVSAPVVVEVVRKMRIVSCNEVIKDERSPGMPPYIKGHQLPHYAGDDPFPHFRRNIIE